MSGRNNSIFSVILCGLLVAANLVVANLLLRGVDWRRDLTEDRRFEIGQGTDQVLSRLRDTMTVRCFVSGNLPKRFQHCDRVMLEKLQEYEKASEGKLVFEFVDPDADESVKQEADDLGIVAARTTEYESATSQRELLCYLAMVFRYGDRQVVMNLFQDMVHSLEDRAEFLADLEYHLTRNIIAVSSPRRTVGILGDLQKVPVDPRNRGGEKRDYLGLQNLRSLLGRSYDVLPLDLKEVNRGAALPQGLDLLLVHAPREVSEVGIYALDQFLMQGGDMLLLVDSGTIDSALKQQMKKIGNQNVRDFELPSWKGEGIEHGLDAWFDHLGIGLERSFVEDDSAFEYVYVHDRRLQKNAFGQIGVAAERKQAPFPAWIEVPARDADGKLLDEKQVGDGSSLITERDTVVLTGVSPLVLHEDRLELLGLKGRVLLRSGPNSGSRPIKENVFSPDPRFAQPRVAGEPAALAISVKGRIPSFFRGKEVPAVIGANGDPLPVPEERGANRRDEAVEPVTLIVVSDADAFTDQRLNEVAAIDRYVNKITNPALANRKATGIVRAAGNAIDRLAYGEDAAVLFDVENRRTFRTREIRAVEEGDEEKRRIDWMIFGAVPGLVLLLGLGRWIMRRLFSIAS
jgi:ABC transporter family protein